MTYDKVRLIEKAEKPCTKKVNGGVERCRCGHMKEHHGFKRCYYLFPIANSAGGNYCECSNFREVWKCASMKKKGKGGG